MLDKLINKVNELEDTARQIQLSDDIPQEQRFALLRRLNDEYRDWYASCISILPDDLGQSFDAEFKGDSLKPKIRSYLESPLEPHPLYSPGHESAGFPKWLYPYSRTFQSPIQQQKTLLLLAGKRPGILISGLEGKVFNDPSYDAKYRKDLFVIMPFLKEMRGVYSDHITTVAKRMSLTIARGDDFFTTESIMQDVWNAIHGAQLIIADCTGRNPNVFYELGIAHTIRKPTIMIAQMEDDIPFDLRHLRCIFYEYTPPGMTKFEIDLQDAIEKIRAT